MVRDSGLSVGAIYTYYRGKDELFLATCDLSSGRLGSLGRVWRRGVPAAEKLAIAMGFFLDGLGGQGTRAGHGLGAGHEWSRAEAEPAIRASLTRRRDQIATVGELLLSEAIANGELPGWIDAPALSGALVSFLDGLLLWRIELGDAYRRDLAERRAVALLRPLLASTSAAQAPALDPRPPRPWSVLGSSGSREPARVPVRH